MYASGSGELARGTFFCLSRRLNFSERGAGVGVYIGSLPRAAVLFVGKPAGREDIRAESFFLLCLDHFMITDGEGKSVAATLFSWLRT